ncbi:hypothetical protein OFD18_36055, partial [Escherichia coli]|nr:hypothetical protein [Escherichia coli]
YTEQVRHARALAAVCTALSTAFAETVPHLVVGAPALATSLQTAVAGTAGARPAFALTPRVLALWASVLRALATRQPAMVVSA